MALTAKPALGRVLGANLAFCAIVDAADASSLRISAGSAQRAPNVADGKLLVPTFDGEVDVYQLNCPAVGPLM
jgi:hypothetical protein